MSLKWSGRDTPKSKRSLPPFPPLENLEPPSPKKRQNMIEFLSKFADLTAGRQFLGSLEEFIEKFEEDYIKDANVKNALIDEVIQYLTQLKSK